MDTSNWPYAVRREGRFFGLRARLAVLYLVLFGR